jgi:hypothetical protein
MFGEARQPPRKETIMPHQLILLFRDQNGQVVSHDLPSVPTIEQATKLAEKIAGQGRWIGVSSNRAASIPPHQIVRIEVENYQIQP